MALLFVYGSLRRGSDNPHARALERDAVWLGPGSVRATVRMVGEYAALKLGGMSDVHGEVWEMPESMWDALDEYEGEDYGRTTAGVKFEDGAVREVWIYFYIRDWPD